MFIPSDTTTEIVAHFLGYFQIAVDDMRMRLTYQEIEAAHAQPFADPRLDQMAADFAQRFNLGTYAPGVAYTPPSWLIHGEAAIDPIAVPNLVAIPAPKLLPPLESVRPFDLDSPSLPLPRIGPEPGSVMAIISQTIILSDNDVVVLGSYDGPLEFNSGADEAIPQMYIAAKQVTGFVTDHAALNNVSDVPVIIETVAHAIGEMATAPDTNGTTLNLTDSVAGTYVNGQIVVEAPELSDVLPAPWGSSYAGTNDDAEDDAEPVSHVELRGDEVPDIVTLKAGGNLLVNEAVMFNGGLTSSVIAVAGDVHQLDAIIQVNAYIDGDTVDAGFPGSQHNPLASTAAYNVASIVQDVLASTDTAAAAANPGVMPANWQVSMVAGDLVFVEWLSQFIFSSDQDLAVLSSTGATTTVTSGENVGLNSVRFADLGMNFDLILIGGNLYDANVIVQTNVLYDNDTVHMLSAEQDGAGSLNTSGNLLWNQASIHNVGPTQFQQGLPDHYEMAMDGLDDGNLYMPAGFSSDSQFEGFHMLRVLYVAGDVYDFRYIEQTNILGDADFVATQQASLMANNPQTEWDISTGSNALVNIASITDYDGMGDTAYAGGSVYSDAVLIQADILAADTDADDPSGDALVTEIVAFLDVDIDLDTGAHNAGDGGFALSSTDGPSADIMQSVLA